VRSPRDTYGSYETYVPSSADDRAMGEIQQALQDAIINARVRQEGLDRSRVDGLVKVVRGRSITVTRDSERSTVRGINQILPIAFVVLMFMGVMTGGQSLLTSTVEEKSNRVMGGAAVGALADGAARGKDCRTARR